MACKNYNIYIDSFDLDNAINNSNPDLDGKVFVSFTDCNDDQSVISYNTSGIYPNAFCADDNDVITLYYFNENSISLTNTSMVTVNGNCITPTPTPSLSITPSITPTITPSTTPSISVTPSITPSNTVAPSMTPTPTISVSKTPSLTPLPSISKTPSRTPSISITPSNGTSPSPTPTTSTTGSIPTIAGLCMNIQFGAAPSVTPSITVSRTPSATPSVTPSITPSTTPSSTNPPPTPSRTPSITVSTTPSVTPSRTSSISITPSITRSISVTPSKTPSPTSGLIAACNTVLYRTQGNQYYSYNFTTNASTLLNVAPNPNPTLDTSNGVPITLAHTSTKSWVYAWDTTTNATVIRESNITLSPFTSTFNRNIALPTGYKPANGLVAINDTTLVGVNKVQYLGVGTSPIKDEYFIVEYNISGATAVATVKFKTPQFKKPVGGFIRTTGSSPKIIMLTQADYAPGSNLYLSQYDYNTGQLEVLQQLTQPVSPNNTGLVTANGNLYIMGFNVYKINTTFPYATTFIQSPGTQLVNASQLPSCSNVVLMPHTCYGGLPPINVPNTVTYSEITISATGTGAATQMWDVPYNTCNVINSTPVSPNSILLGGKWQASPGTPTSFTYIMNFSQPVNNIRLLMAAMNGTPVSSPGESFTFTSNGGNVTVSSTNNCFSTISGNTITANEGGVATPGGAGTFLISSQTPFTQLTVTGPGGLGGTVMSIDCENLFAAPIVTPPPTPPTPSISPGTNILGCVYFTKNTNSYLYDVINNISTPVTIPGIFATNETHTLNKYWRINSTTNEIKEWDSTSTPNVLTLNRTILVTGLTGTGVIMWDPIAINNTTLLVPITQLVPPTANTALVGSYKNTMTLLDITTNTVGPAQRTSLFDVYAPAGNLDATLLTTNNKLITIGRRGVNGVFPGIYYLSQYSYPDGTLELDIDISSYLPNTTNPHYQLSLFQSNNGKLYLHVWAQNISNTSNIYEINLNYPYNWILLRNDNSQWGGYFNSSLNCNTVALNQPPQPSMSPTPTPSLTPPVSPNVGVNTIYKYLDIL